MIDHLAADIEKCVPQYAGPGGEALSAAIRRTLLFHRGTVDGMLGEHRRHFTVEHFVSMLVGEVATVLGAEWRKVCEHQMSRVRAEAATGVPQPTDR